MKQRYCVSQILKLSESTRGRLILLTGARQTGKSTILKEVFKNYRYFALDDPDIRLRISSLTPAQLVEFYPLAIWDEIQKAPAFIEKIKAAYDMSPNVRYILSGSSQILLLKHVKESLAGRVAIIELYPLTIPEMLSNCQFVSGMEQKSMIVQLIEKLIDGQQLKNIAEKIDPLLTLNSQYPDMMRQWENYINWGAMPRLFDSTFTESDKIQWLIDYNKTYLQRDLSDLSRLDSLEPFIDAQKALSIRNASIINISELARTISVSVPTMKRFFRYLELSYQIIELKAWSKNYTKRLVKAPKVLFIDPGICRSLIRRTGDLDGHEYEGCVISEIIKQGKTLGLPVEYYHVRTSDGREVDLLIETPAGFIAVEVKMSKNAKPEDCRHFINLDSILDKQIIGTFLLTNDFSVRFFEKTNTIAIPAPFALGICSY